MLGDTLKSNQYRMIFQTISSKAKMVISLASSLICFLVISASIGKADDKPLLFLGNHDIPPMIYLNNKSPEGIVVDLVKAIIAKSALNARVEAMDWGAAQEKLKDGSADALLQINSNPEREKVFNFSEPLLKTEFSIFRRSDHIDLQNIKSLYGRSVGVEKKGYPLSILKKHPQIKIVIIPSWSSGFKKLSSGKIDAVIVDRWVGEYELSKLNLTNIVVNKKPVEVSHSMIAVRKGSDELLAKINQGIRQIRADGSYDRILSSWQNYEVIYLTRGQQIFYFASFAIAFIVLILVAGGIYVHRITMDNRLKSELNRQLESRNDELLQFAYRTSHDLKSPLTSSKQLLRFAAKDIDSGNTAEAIRNVKAVEKQMIKLENLVISVLDMATAEFKEQETELINFEEILDEIKERLPLNLSDQTCEIILSDTTTNPVYFSRVRLTQIIENLVSNGVKYRDRTNQNPFVKVTVSNDNNDLLIVVEDNGLGIPEAHRDKIFEMFQRFHPEIEAGSGLGLNIVRKHIDVLNGNIKLTSAENQGARFEIRIPAEVEQ